jgi:hypothetical protein
VCKDGVVKLDKLLIVLVFIIRVGCHDEQVAPREGDEVVLEVDLDVVTLVEGVTTDYMIGLETELVILPSVS